MEINEFESDLWMEPLTKVQDMWMEFFEMKNIAGSHNQGIVHMPDTPKKAYVIENQNTVNYLNRTISALPQANDDHIGITHKTINVFKENIDFLKRIASMPMSKLENIAHKSEIKEDDNNHL